MMFQDELDAQALRECATGALSANMALMRLCLDTPDRRRALRILQNAIDRESGAARDRLLEVETLWRETPDAFDLIRTIARTESVDGGDGIARCAAGFDVVADVSPIASVALYSLGREDILLQATAEVVDDLRREGLLRHDYRLLDIGCGSGRFLAALAPELWHVVGVDVSANMLAHARRRCADFSNVELLLGDGRRFAALPDASFGLALAVDSFPYIIAAGDDVTRANLEEARRLLRPDGRLIIINYSYRGDDEMDRRDVHRFAHEFGFAVRRCGFRPFRLWDGAVFDLQRLTA